MELWKMILLLTGLASVNLASACSMKRVNLPSRFPLIKETDERITKAVRPVLSSLFNLGDIAAEKFSYHIESKEENMKVIIRLFNLSPDEITALHKKLEEMTIMRVVHSWVVNSAIGKLLDTIVINGRVLNGVEWYFNGQVNPTSEKGSFLLFIIVEPVRLQPKNKFLGFRGLIAVHTLRLKFDGPAYNSIKVDSPEDNILKIDE